MNNCTTGLSKTHQDSLRTLQNSPGLSRTHSGGITGDPRSHRTTFHSISHTSPRPRREGRRGFRLDSRGFTWLDLLKPQRLPANWRAGGENGTGGIAGRLGSENSQKLTRTHQESPEPIQEAPEMLQELTEPLFIPFRTLHPDLGGRAGAGFV